MTHTRGPFVQNITQSLRKDPAAYTTDSLFASLIDEARGHQPRQAADTLLHSSQRQQVHVKNRFKQQPYQNAFCRNCKKTGHLIGDCWWLHENKLPRDWVQNTKNNNKINKYPTTRSTATKKPPSFAITLRLLRVVHRTDDQGRRVPYRATPFSTLTPT